MQHHRLIGADRQIDLIYAEEWDEMTQEQAVYAGDMLFELVSKTITVDQFRKRMVDKFINRDNRGNDKPGEFDYKMDMWANEGQLMDTVNFFFSITKDEKTGNESFEILPNGIKMHVPMVEINGIKHHGPGDFMQNMTFLQFKDALAASQKYMETQEMEWLARLAAILYQRKNEVYKQERIVSRINQFAKPGKGILMLSFYYLMGCMQVIRTDGNGNGIEIDGNKCMFSRIFKKGAGEGQGRGGGEGIGLTGVLMSLAESGVFGTIKDTADANVWDVLTRLYQLELQREEMEAAMKK